MRKRILLLLVILCYSVIGFAQQNVTGKVTSSEDGEPLPGVNVVVKGTTNGTITDLEGIYNLSVANDAIIVFSELPVHSKRHRCPICFVDAC